MKLAIFLRRDYFIVVDDVLPLRKNLLFNYVLKNSFFFFLLSLFFCTLIFNKKFIIIIFRARCFMFFVQNFVSCVMKRKSIWKSRCLCLIFCSPTKLPVSYYFAFRFGSIFMFFVFCFFFRFWSFALRTTIFRFVLLKLSFKKNLLVVNYFLLASLKKWLICFSIISHPNLILIFKITQNRNFFTQM